MAEQSGHRCTCSQNVENNRNDEDNDKRNENKSKYVSKASRKEFRSAVKKPPKKSVLTGQRTAKAYHLQGTTNAVKNMRDDCATFGEHLACKMRQYDRRSKNYVQHLINNILFDADMGKLHQTLRMVSPSPRSLLQFPMSPSQVSAASGQNSPANGRLNENSPASGSSSWFNPKMEPLDDAYYS